MHNNNNYQCKMCWNKALTFGIGLIQLSFRTIAFTKYRQRCFQSTFQSNCAEGLHFSAFHLKHFSSSTYLHKGCRRRRTGLGQCPALHLSLSDHETETLLAAGTGPAEQVSCWSPVHCTQTRDHRRQEAVRGKQGCFGGEGGG